MTRTFTLTVTDNDGATATDTVVITVESPNAAPTANAGPDRTVASGTEVTLDGSGSNDNGDLDGDGTIASYAWWTAPDSVTLTGANTASPGFTAPTLDAGAEDVRLVFFLQVQDNDGAFINDAVVITVEAPNAAPSADAGPDQAVRSGATVTLDGSASSDSDLDGDGSIVSHAWTQASGTDVPLTGANSAAPSFTAPTVVAGAANVALTFTLTVTDNDGATASDTVAITVTPPNAVPTANAGSDRTVASGATVSLDGSASSDSDGTIATYAWTGPDGITLSGTDTASPSFTPTLDAGALDVTLSFTLTVTDNDGATASDTVVITVEAPNAVPTANAGPERTVASGTPIILNGSGSNDNGDLDGDGSIASYEWTLPAFGNVVLYRTERARFPTETLAAGAADVTLTFTLTVTDNDGATATDTVVITVEAPNAVPTANAGPDRTVPSAALVTLDGSGSNDAGDLDGDGSIASYAWIQARGPDVILTGANSARPRFIAPPLAAGAADETLIFTLAVTDNDGATATDTVVITVEAPNVAPTANAGPAQAVASGDTVTLDGSASSDIDGSITTYAWTAPDGVTLTGADTARPRFIAPPLAAGAADVTRTFTLTVTDNDRVTATDTVVITVEAPNAAPTANAGPDCRFWRHCHAGRLRLERRRRSGWQRLDCIL